MSLLSHLQLPTGQTSPTAMPSVGVGAVTQGMHTKRREQIWDVYCCTLQLHKVVVY